MTDAVKICSGHKVSKLSPQVVFTAEEIRSAKEFFSKGPASQLTPDDQVRHNTWQFEYLVRVLEKSGHFAVLEAAGTVFFVSTFGTPFY